jgi:hypothetical protein
MTINVKLVTALAVLAVKVKSEIESKQQGLLTEARKIGLVAATPEQQRDGFKPEEGLMSAFRAALSANWCAIQPNVAYKVLNETTGKVEQCKADDKGAVTLTAAYAVTLGDAAYRKLAGDAGDTTTIKGLVGKFRKAGSTHVSDIVRMIERLAAGGSARGGAQERLEWREKLDPKNKKSLAHKLQSAAKAAGISEIKFAACWALFVTEINKA